MIDYCIAMVIWISASIICVTGLALISPELAMYIGVHAVVTVGIITIIFMIVRQAILNKKH